MGLIKRQEIYDVRRRAETDTPINEQSPKIACHTAMTALKKKNLINPTEELMPNASDVIVQTQFSFITVSKMKSAQMVFVIPMNIGNTNVGLVINTLK